MSTSSGNQGVEAKVVLLLPDCPVLPELPLISVRVKVKNKEIACRIQERDFNLIITPHLAPSHTH